MIFNFKKKANSVFNIENMVNYVPRVWNKSFGSLLAKNFEHCFHMVSHQICHISSALQVNHRASCNHDCRGKEFVFCCTCLAWLLFGPDQFFVLLDYCLVQIKFCASANKKITPKQKWFSNSWMIFRTLDHVMLRRKRIFCSPSANFSSAANHFLPSDIACVIFVRPFFHHKFVTRSGLIFSLLVGVKVGKDQKSPMRITGS
jgi:hypothetical protein